jgi:hypothetical protein
MKRALSIAAQFLLFLLVDAIGSLFYHPFQIQTSLAATPSAPRSFMWDGLVLMALLYAIFLVIAALRKRLNISALNSTVAVALAILAGYLLKLGFITRNW